MNHKRDILQFTGVACLIVCVLFAIVSLPFFWKQYQVLHSWPVTDAQVLRSDITSAPAPGHEQLYAAKLQILYTVDGRPITAELTSFESSNYQSTESRASEFAVGSHHAVRYDPRNPSQARIGAAWDRRFFALPLIVLAMGAAFGLTAMVTLAWARQGGVASKPV